MSFDARDAEQEDFRRKQAQDAAVRLSLRGWTSEAARMDRAAANHRQWAERMREGR